MANNPLTSQKKVQDIAYDILKQSKSLGVYPTPTDKIVQFTELQISENKYIERIPKNYASKSIDTLKRALRKVNGILDRRTKTIYVDSNLIPARRNFIKLHEVGHDVLPWQREMFEIIEDDEISLRPDAKEEFELEASYFASEVLFQGEYFDELIKKYPLEIGTPIALANKFGASIHASMRKFVESSKKRCALLVLKDLSVTNLNCQTKNFIQSCSFKETFGRIFWDCTLDVKWPFVQDYISHTKHTTDGSFQMNLNGNGQCVFEYQFFNNSWNAFVLMFPVGESQKSKTKIKIR